MGGANQNLIRLDPPERGTVCHQTNFTDVVQGNSRFHRKAKSNLTNVAANDKSIKGNSSSRLSATKRERNLSNNIYQNSSIFFNAYYRHNFKE